MVYTSPDSAHIKLFNAFLHKKQQLAVDAWGADDTPVRHIYGPLEDLIKQNVETEEDVEIYPWRLGRRVGT